MPRRWFRPSRSSVATLANTQLGSGFGENPFSRLAVTPTGEHAAAGSTVDGDSVSYERVAPGILVLPVYFNPQTLESPDRDGNRVILTTFDDQYGTPFNVVGRSDTASAYFFDGSGVPIVTTPVTVDGVLLSNLQAIAGGPDVLTGSGKVFFDVDPGNGNYFVDFTDPNWAPFVTIALVSVSQRVPAGPFAQIAFLCDAPPALDEFACTVIEVSDLSGTVLPGQCSLSLQ